MESALESAESMVVSQQTEGREWMSREFIHRFADNSYSDHVMMQNHNAIILIYRTQDFFSPQKLAREQEVQ